MVRHAPRHALNKKMYTSSGTQPNANTKASTNSTFQAAMTIMVCSIHAHTPLHHRHSTPTHKDQLRGTFLQRSHGYTVDTCAACATRMCSTWSAPAAGLLAGGARINRMTRLLLHAWNQQLTTGGFAQHPTRETLDFSHKFARDYVRTCLKQALSCANALEPPDFAHSSNTQVARTFLNSSLPLQRAVSQQAAHYSSTGSRRHYEITVLRTWSTSL